MTPPQPVGEPIWRELDRPREPSEPERRLLISLAAAVDEPMLHAQVATVVVDATCRCGCSSVRLCSGQPAIPTERVARLSRTGRPDYFAVTATGRGGVDVVLHAMHGRVIELEVYDRINGDGHAVPPEGVLDLGDVSVE